MFHTIKSVAVAAALLFASPAVAADSDKNQVAKKESADDLVGDLSSDKKPEGSDAKAAAQVNQGPKKESDKLAIFVLEKGWYVSTDLGVFFTFGGARGASGVQPYLMLKAGYDITDHIAIQLVAGAGFSADNAANTSVGGSKDYGMYLLHPEIVYSARPLERLELRLRAGGGMAVFTPAPTDPNNRNANLSAVHGQISSGFDLVYLTLLTDFSAGVSTTGYYVLGINVPALSAGAFLKYTF